MKKLSIVAVAITLTAIVYIPVAHGNWFTERLQKLHAYMFGKKEIESLDIPGSNNNPAQNITSEYLYPEIPITTASSTEYGWNRNIDKPNKLKCDIETTGAIIVKGSDTKESSLKSKKYNFILHKWGPNSKMDITKVTNKNGILHVKYNKAKDGNEDSYAVFEFTVPKSCNIDLELASGNVNVQSIEGDINIDIKGSGNIYAPNIASNNAEFNLNNGKLDVSYQEGSNRLPITCIINGNKIESTIIAPRSSYPDADNEIKKNNTIIMAAPSDMQTNPVYRQFTVKGKAKNSSIRIKLP